MTESDVKEFIEKCYETGQKIYGLGDIQRYGLTFYPIISPCIVRDTIVLPEELEYTPLNCGDRYSITHEVSHNLVDITAPYSKYKMDEDCKNRENFSLRNWSNYLVNDGVEEGRADSGSERILLLLNDEEAARESDRLRQFIPGRWPRFSKIVLEDLEKHSIRSYNTKDVIRLVNEGFRTSINQIKRNDWFEMRCTIENAISLPYFLTAYPLVQELGSKDFQEFAKKWKPRDLDKEISEVDPIKHFLVSSNFRVPEDHEKAIKDDIALALKG